MTVTVGVLAVGVYGAGRLFAAKGLDWADKVSSVVSAALALLGLAVGVLVRLWRLAPEPRLVSEQDIAQTGDDLAAALGRLWAGEERLRRVHDPRPMPIRWDSADPARAAFGWYGDVLAFFRDLPARRVVFLGSAGAGKSVLVVKLARDLLHTRGAGDPVPVIFPAGEWGPGVDLGQWLAEELTRRYSGLAEEVRLGTGEIGRLADLLVAGGRVIPILDGLDELPEVSRAEAIAQVNDLGSELPLAVTSRPDEYQDAVRGAGRGITVATVVELRPLRVPEVEDYLREATAARPDGRWDPLLARLHAEPDGPLAAALTTPLLLGLARTVYEDGDGDADPAELADWARFADRAAIESHLLEEFVPAVYAPRTYRVGPARPRYTARQATRWLAFLAWHLRRTGTQELAWWRLFPAVGAGDGLVQVVRFGLLGYLGWALLGWLLRGYGWTPGRDAGSVPWRRILLGGPLGGHLRPIFDPVITWLADRVGDDLAAVLDALLRPSIFAWLAVMILALAVSGGSDGEPKALAFTPLAAARRLVVGAWYIAVLDGVGVIVYLSFWPPGLASRADAAGLMTSVAWSPVNRDILLLSLLVIAVRLPTWLITRVPVATDRRARPRPDRSGHRERPDPGLLGPRELLRLDRRADLVTTVAGRLAFGTALALLVAGRLAAAYAAFAAAVTLVAALLGGTRRANRRYRDARLSLFLGRRLPLRPMAFLADAHQRGVLRRTGPVYQFRHIRLQEHLAGCHPRWRPYLRPVLDALERRAEQKQRAPAERRPARGRWASIRSSRLIRCLMRIARPIGEAARRATHWLDDSNERDHARRAASRAAWRRLIGLLRPGDLPPVTGYPDIDHLLVRLRRRLPARLGADLVGLYLHGSLTTEDFDLRHSDIDLLAVVRTHPDRRTRRAVDALLGELTGELPRAIRAGLEWVTVDELASTDPLAPPQPGELLTFASAPLLMRRALRDRGRAVVGPPPRTLVPAVPLPDYKTAFDHHLDALSTIDWQAATERDRLAAVRIACRGLRVCQGARLPQLTPPWMSVPGALRRHFWAVRAALLRRPRMQPEVLVQILTAARASLTGPATAAGDRTDPEVRPPG